MSGQASAPASDPGDLGEVLSVLAGGLARQVGLVIRDGRRAGVPGVETKSTATDMVTEFDRLAERLIVERLRNERPSDGVIGEEGTEIVGWSGVRWLIDPIDGTTNFLYGLPGYAVSIAALDHEGGLAAAVHVPATDELFVAARGRGATMNGLPIAPSRTTALTNALVGTGFSYVPERRARQAERVGRIISSVRDVRRLGAAAADLCYVAAGRLDVYYEEYLNPWDLAAGELIAREAGCRLGDLTGGPVRPEQTLVTTPALYDAFVELVAATGT